MTQIIANKKTMLAINSQSTRRANVIAHRTDSTAMGLAKAEMIEVLKFKLRNGIAHFLFLKKDGTVREAWGTTCSNLMRSSINGTGITRDMVNCVCFWDVQKGTFRSLRFENIIQVF